MKSPLFIYFLGVYILLVSYVTNNCPVYMLMKTYAYFFLLSMINFWVLVLIFRPMIYFEIIPIYDVRQGSTWLFCMCISISLRATCGNYYSFPVKMSAPLSKNQLNTDEVKVAQLCPTFCDPMDYMVHGILQARILEWVAFPFSRRSSQPRDWIQVSCIAGGFFTSWATREAQITDERYL